MRNSGDNIKIVVNGQTVNYDDNGPVNAPTIIFIHGFPFNKSVWRLQAELFKNNYRVIAYDIRGHGESTSGDQPPSIELFTEDLIAFMNLLNLEKVMLCGLSMGGHVALNAIQKYPGRFISLVLSGTKCPADNEEAREQRIVEKQQLKEKGIDNYADESLKRLFAPVSFSTRKEEVRATRKMIVENNPEEVSRTLAALAERKETCSGLAQINVPVLILVGKEDKITPPTEAQYLNERIKGSQLSVIEYAGHLANLENTHEYNEILGKFIDQVCESKELSFHSQADR